MTLFFLPWLNKNNLFSLFSVSKPCLSVPFFCLFHGAGTFPIFSNFASYIPFSCGNTSESRLDLFWDRPPVAFYRDQREDCLPLWGPPAMVSTLRHCVPPMICFFLAQWLSGDPNAVLLSVAVLINCITGVGLFEVTLLLTNVYKVHEEKSLWVLPLPPERKCSLFPASFEFLLLINAWHCLLMWCLGPKGYCGACMYMI